MSASKEPHVTVERGGVKGYVLAVAQTAADGSVSRFEVELTLASLDVLSAAIDELLGPRA